MTLQRSHPRAKHRWLVALVSVAMLLGLTAGAAFAILKDGSFELRPQRHQRRGGPR